MILLASDPATRAIAADRVRANVARLVAGQDRDVAKLLGILDEARARIVARLVDASEYDMARLPAMRDEMDRQIAMLRGRMPGEFRAGFRAAADQGDGDTRAYGATLLSDDGVHLSSGLSMHLIDYASQASADLVGQIGRQARANINRILTIGATGASSPADVAKALGTVLAGERRPTGVFGTLATQVERVHRTATAAFYEDASRARQERVAQESPYEMLKRWIWTPGANTRPAHHALNGVTIPVADYFELNGVKCDGPHDSILPAEDAVNCKCTTGLVRGPRKEGR